jgi:hydroxymethylpyrimidine pyrophosphatase-like HAD family hydrolase
MRYLVLATDYDGTLAAEGRVADSTVAALERLLATGRRLVLVTGRELPELLEIFPRIELFEWVVAENGALLYSPSTKEEFVLAPPPPAEFVASLRERDVGPISVGRSIVATWEPHETTVLQTIHDLGLELQVIFNTGAVMVLPAGVNKATGLQAALAEMGISPHNVVAIGDAENDHALLRLCEMSVAVDNALGALKAHADVVTRGCRGAGVEELIDALTGDDLASYEDRLERHRVPLGTILADGGKDAGEFRLSPFGPTVLVAGPSASGKSTFTTSFLEALARQKYQFCIIDPEGDYELLEAAIVLGGPERPPVEEEIEHLLLADKGSLVVSLTGMQIADRPPFLLTLLPELLKIRARTGRPHWIVLDEAHHLMPAEWEPPGGVLPEHLSSLLMVTVHPELLATAVLKRVSTIIAVGGDAGTTLTHFAAAAEVAPPPLRVTSVESGEALIWTPESGRPPERVRTHPSKTERRRHRRKYAEGELPPDRSFYFRGPAKELNLRAQNLILFLQLADGVDDRTWDHHLRKGDYARWFREGIKDDTLAAEAERIGSLHGVTAVESRRLIRAAVERDYTLPASPPLPVAGAG